MPLSVNSEGSKEATYESNNPQNRFSVHLFFGDSILSLSAATTNAIEVQYEHTASFPQVLAHTGCSLLVSTYQSQKVFVIGTQVTPSGNLTLKIAFHSFEQAMGIAACTHTIAIGTRRSVEFLKSAHELAPSIDPNTPHDRCWIARQSLYTGSIHGHDLAWGKSGLWVVNTLFSCLCTLDTQYNFVPQWRPSFISQLIDQDRCHFNGLALKNGEPAYASVLGETDAPAGWRENKISGGALLDIRQNQTIVRGLCMPHSPRVHRDQLWFLNSGKGDLSLVDVNRGAIEPVAKMPGYTRGLSFYGQYAFVGLSRIRESNVFGGLPIGEHPDQLKCGIGVIDINTGQTVATFQFASGVEEIFAVEVLPETLHPKLVGPKLDETTDREIWVVPSNPSSSMAGSDQPSASQSKLASASGEPVPSTGYSHLTSGELRDSGVLAHEQGKLEEAFHLLTQAVSTANSVADRALALTSLGSLLQDLGREEEAIERYQLAIAAAPTLAAAHQNLGVLLLARNRPHEALEHFGKAQGVRPNPMNYVLAAQSLPILYQNTEEIAYWRHRLENRLGDIVADRIIIDATETVIPTSFYFAYQGYNDRHIMSLLAQIYRGKRWCEPASQTGHRPKGKRIKIGLLSANFCNHTIGRLNIGLVTQLDREQFEVTVIALRKHQDNLSERFRQAADRYVEVPRHPAKAGAQIAALGLDMILFADVGMDCVTQSLSYCRMAPVQIATWGHPVTTGSPEIDYFLSSDLAESPDADTHYTERLARLPSMGVYYERPVLTSDALDRQSMGFRANQHIYLCPQTLYKFHPQFDEVLSGILEADPRGELVLIEGRLPAWTSAFQARLRRRMSPGVFRRIRFLPAMPTGKYLNLLSIGDVMLDPHPFGGGNSIYESLAMGTPVVTWPSEFLRGRLATGLFRQIALPSLHSTSASSSSCDLAENCVTNSAAEYIQRAVSIASDKDLQHAIRQTITERHTGLFSHSQSINDIALFLKAAFSR